MTYSIIVRSEAESDIRLAFNWYEDRARGLGIEFLRSIDAAISSISRLPKSHSEIYKHVRRALVRRFPFGVFYIITDKSIIILAVMHVKQHPTQWHKRS